MYCDYILGGKSFQNKKSHIHLSGDTSLRTGLIGKVCTAAPDEVKAEFKLLEMTKRLEKEQIVKKRKRAEELLKCKKIIYNAPVQAKRTVLKEHHHTIKRSSWRGLGHCLFWIGYTCHQDSQPFIS